MSKHVGLVAICTIQDLVHKIYNVNPTILCVIVFNVCVNRQPQFLHLIVSPRYIVSLT